MHQVWQPADKQLLENGLQRLRLRRGMPVLIAVSQSNAHLAGTLLPRGFFLGVGLVYLAALALDQLAAPGGCGDSAAWLSHSE